MKSGNFSVTSICFIKNLFRSFSTDLHHFILLHFSTPHLPKTPWLNIHNKFLSFSCSIPSTRALTFFVLSVLVIVASLKSNVRSRYVLSFLLSVLPSYQTSTISMFRPNNINYIISFPRPVLIPVTNSIDRHHHSPQTFSSLSPAPSVMRRFTISVTDGFNYRSTWRMKLCTLQSNPFHPSASRNTFRSFPKSFLSSFMSYNCSPFVPKMITTHRAPPTHLRKAILL